MSSVTSLDQLNLDTLYLVLDHLDERDRSMLRLLNKRWHTLISDYRRHQRELVYCCKYKGFNEKLYRSCDLRWFLEQYPNLRSLSLDLDFLVERQRIKFLGNHGWLLRIVNALPRLEYFKLLVPGPLIDGTRLDHLGQLRHLYELHIECLIDANQFARVLEKCISLKRLTFNNRGRSPARGLASAFACLRDNLESVCFKTHSSTSIENCLNHLIVKNPSLREFIIALAPTYPSMLMRICQSFPKLEVLEFNDINANFTPPAFAPVQPPNNYIPLNELAHDANAERMNRENTVWHRLRDVPIDSLANLRVLRACCSIRVTDAQSIISRCARYRTIEKLHLEFVSIPISQSNLFINRVCTSCPKLKHLSLYGLSSVCFLSALEEFSQLNHLTVLELKFRHKIYTKSFALSWRTHHEKFARRIQRISISSFALDDSIPLSVWGPLHRKAREYRRSIQMRVFTCSQGTLMFKIGDAINDTTETIDALCDAQAKKGKAVDENGL